MLANCRWNRRWIITAVLCGAMAPALGQSAIVMEPLSGLPIGAIGSAAYDVSADGQKFVVVRRARETNLGYVVSLNWTAGLKKP